MQVLYGARMAIVDLLRAANNLACYITKWTSDCDKRLHILISYINSSKHLRMVGWIGDDLDALQPHLLCYSDLAGCMDTLRSTSGVHLAIRGPSTCFPISGFSKRQGCVSFSTPESETVAANFGLRMCGLPCLDLWEVLIPHRPCVMFHEDNQAMIVVVRTGRSPTMRYLKRTHGVEVAWLNEVFKNPDLQLVYELSAKMAADMYTKGFVDHQQFAQAQWLFNVFDSAILNSAGKMRELLASSTTQSGGDPIALEPKKVPPPEGLPSKTGLTEDEWGRPIQNSKF